LEEKQGYCRTLTLSQRERGQSHLHIQKGELREVPLIKGDTGGSPPLSRRRKIPPPWWMGTNGAGVKRLQPASAVVQIRLLERG